MKAGVVADLSEKEFQRQVTSFAAQCGWKWWHVNDSRKMVKKNGAYTLIGDSDIKGFPDLILAHGSRGMVFAELKKRGEKAEPDQVVALDLLATTAMSMAVNGGAPKMRVHLWHPADFPTVVMDVLLHGTGPIVYGW